MFSQLLLARSMRMGLFQVRHRLLSVAFPGRVYARVQVRLLGFGMRRYRVLTAQLARGTAMILFNLFRLGAHPIGMARLLVV